MSKPFEMNVHNDLLRELYMSGIDSNDAMTFFTELITNLQQYEPNFGPQKKNNFNRHTYPFWMVKGFYPNTTVMFRAVLIDKASPNVMLPSAFDDRGGMYAKISKGTYRLPKGTPAATSVLGNEQRKLLENRAEGLILEADVKLKEQIAPIFKVPRCVSPKGMALYNLKRKMLK